MTWKELIRLKTSNLPSNQQKSAKNMDLAPLDVVQQGFFFYLAVNKLITSKAQSIFI